MKLKRPVQYLVILLTLVVTFLQIGLAAKPPVTDDLLYDEIRSKLAADQVVKGGAIEVEVHDGVVVLKGKVEEERQKDKAEKVAKKVNGVKSVKNEIVLSRP
jgi:osmotically-inducible protein OsmY